MDEAVEDGFSFGKLFKILSQSVFVYIVFEKDEDVEPDKYMWKEQIFKKVTRIDVLEKKVALLKGVEAKVKKLDFQMETLSKLITKKPKKKAGQNDDDEE
jgi:hypothetical protein